MNQLSSRFSNYMFLFIYFLLEIYSGHQSLVVAGQHRLKIKEKHLVEFKFTSVFALKKVSKFPAVLIMKLENFDNFEEDEI